MVTLLMLMCLNFAVVICGSAKPGSIPVMNNKASCYSEASFEIVYASLKEEIENGNKDFYAFEGKELYVKDSVKIIIKKNNYTHAVIHREKGIYSLAKVLKDNQALVRNANELFCKILALQEEKR